MTPSASRLVNRFDVACAIPEARRGPQSTRIDVAADWPGKGWFLVINPAAIG